MDRSELDIIKELMAELESKMEYGEEDFNERLGRKKPEVEVVKMEGELPMSEEEEGSEDMTDLLSEEMGEEESVESKLKARLMKLRS